MTSRTASPLGEAGGTPCVRRAPIPAFLGQLDQEPFLYPDVNGLGVVLSNGEFVHQVTDLRIPGRGFDFEFVRTYRSRNNIDTIVGMVWHYDGGGSIIE